MTTALIFAGGTGQRMNSRSKPKQFLELHGKPILIYTLEHFQVHKDVDKILVVCLKPWIDELKKYVRRYELDKVFDIVPGGSTGHESIFLGLQALKDVCKDDDIVLIHDGVRPLITEDLITRNIKRAQQCKAVVTVAPASESVVQINDGETIANVPDRSKMFIAKAPQTFTYSLIYEAYQRAAKDGVLTVDSADLLSRYGYKIYYEKSTPYNIKITSPSDYYIFRALYEAMENSQIFGLE